jgi:hypothetical protein
MSPPRCRSLAPLMAVAFAGCTPYAVHTSARPLQEGDRSRSMIVSVVPGGARIDEDSTQESIALPSFDVDWRYGLDDRSDIGFRLNTASGGIVTWRRRLDGPSSRPTTATALMLGAGLVNFGQHAHVEATLIRSGREGGSVVPYGGLRAIQIAPLSSTAVHDRPTLGAFGGARFGGAAARIGVEVGVFYDRSALGLRRNDFVVVPSFSVNSIRLGRKRADDR